MMEENEDELIRLNRNYNQNVIPKITGVEQKGNFISSSGISGKRYSIDLDENEFLKVNKQYLPQSNKFVHFTSIKVLFAILRENKLRLYDLDNSNDPFEFNLVFNQFKKYQRNAEWYKRKLYTISFCSSDILNVENPDSLNLWRLYGGNGNGIAIEFEFESPLLFEKNFLLSNIIYDKLDLNEFIEANDRFESENNVEVDFKELLMIPSCLHKNPAYTIEKEIRLIYFRKYAIGSSNSEINNYFKDDVNSSNELVKYLDLPLYSSSHIFPKIKISKIQFGFKFSETKFKYLEQKIQKIISDKIIRENTYPWADYPILDLSPLINIFK